MNCIPSSIASNLPKAIPNIVPDVENNGVVLTDGVGNVIFKSPVTQIKDVYEFANLTHGMTPMVTYRNRLRDILLEGVPVQCDKKCIRYEETQDGVWVFFKDGSQEFCNILVGADGINSPSKDL